MKIAYSHLDSNVSKTNMIVGKLLIGIQKIFVTPMFCIYSSGSGNYLEQDIKHKNDQNKEKAKAFGLQLCSVCCSTNY